MQSYDKYIFDVDYTLLIPDWSNEDEFFKKHIKKEEQKSFFEQKINILNEYEQKFSKYDFKTLSDFYKSFGFDLSDKLIEEWMYFNALYIQDTVPIGTIELLDYLKANNKQVVILTNWFSGTQIPRLKRAGLMQYVDNVIAGETAMKPSSVAFQLAIKDTDKAKCLMIGDSIRCDKTGAENIGIDFYLVDDSHSILDLLNSIKYSKQIKK